MENKQNKLSRRDFLKAVGVIAGSAALASCNLPAEEPVVMPTIIAPETIIATTSPSNTPESTETTVPTNTPETPLHYGEFDMKTTPFSIKPTSETEKFLGYIPGGFPETFADIPLPFGMSDIGSEEQLALQEEQNKQFEKAAKKHPLNPYYVVNSDMPKLTFFNFHSVQESACGEVARVVGAYAFNHPEKIDKLLGNKFIVTFDQKTSVNAEIVHSATITKAYFDDLTETGPWGIDEQTGGLFGKTWKFDIPNTIRHDQTPGVYYMTLIGCQGKEPGKISLWLSQNIANRSLVTLKFSFA